MTPDPKPIVIVDEVVGMNEAEIREAIAKAKANSKGLFEQMYVGSWSTDPRPASDWIPNDDVVEDTDQDTEGTDETRQEPRKKRI